ncbi:MAG: hypothetical protein L0Y68_06385 [Candidatus Dadabacteria bacterium]|nr:hypothetical protein [Candidatus Dadabacteria bacterium]
MNAKNRIVYSVNVEDLQNVAEQELDRELSDKEIRFIEERLGDYIDWYGAIASTFNELTKKRFKPKKV